MAKKRKQDRGIVLVEDAFDKTRTKRGATKRQKAVTPPSDEDGFPLLVYGRLDRLGSSDGSEVSARLSLSEKAGALVGEPPTDCTPTSPIGVYLFIGATRAHNGIVWANGRDPISIANSHMRKGACP